MLDAFVAVVVALAAAATYAWLPSWRAAAALVAVSVAVGLAAPGSTASAALAPSHLGASLLLIVCGLQSAGLRQDAAQAVAAALLIALAVAAARAKKSRQGA